MSGHNTICVATALLETGMVPMKEEIVTFKLESPGGLVEVEAQCADGKAVSILLKSVPSFVAHLDVVVSVPEIGEVVMDIAFGGMWYAIVDAASVGLELRPELGRKICRLGEMIKVKSHKICLHCAALACHSCISHAV